MVGALATLALAVGGAGARTAAAPAAAGQAATAPSAAGLIARLAVLRRPQTPADVLPANAPPLPSPPGRIIPGLTRLVAVLPNLRLYLVVATPTRGSLPLWAPALGDQATYRRRGAARARRRPAVPGRGP
jgi:hypothetical protein